MLTSVLEHARACATVHLGFFKGFKIDYTNTNILLPHCQSRFHFAVQPENWHFG